MCHQPSPTNGCAFAPIWLVAGILISSTPPLLRSAPAPALLSELGCANCHSTLPTPSPLRELTPDLSSAGLRYNPGYLLDYLQSPVQVRRHLGAARMPNFYFDEPEALAVVAFLETQRVLAGAWPELPAGVKAPTGSKSRALSANEVQGAKTQTLACQVCHSLEGKGGNRAAEMADFSYRLQPDWVSRLLVEPRMFGIQPTNMPGLFYRLSEDRRQFRDLIAQPSEKIRLITDYLFSLNADRRKALDQKYLAAKTKYPQANAALGEAIFRSQNCAACHRVPGVQPRRDAGPDLLAEVARVQPDWLRNFLPHQKSIRPFGYYPGDGSRMPDFHLSESESSDISNYLLSLNNSPSGIPTNFQAKPLSAFAQNKANLLLHEKLSCLGCHRLGTEGGRIAPDLAHAATRLRPEYIYGMITNPRRTNPHTIMPQLPITVETAQLIASFLSSPNFSPEPPAYLSVSENRLIPSLPANKSPASLKLAPSEEYLAHCSGCHGQEGRGDGFNARFLPKAPAQHADPAYMSTRPNDTLYDGVAAGGAILNKSHFMPPWGSTLSPDEIQGLVGYMRTLCHCQPPPWSVQPKVRTANN